MAEVINWQEKYVNYVEGDLQKDIQELKDGQKALQSEVRGVETRINAKVESEVTRMRSGDIQDLKNGHNALDAKIERAEENLRKEIKEVGAKIDRFFWPLILLLAAGVIGGVVKTFTG